MPAGRISHAGPRIGQAAELFGVFADPLRLQVIDALSERELDSIALAKRLRVEWADLLGELVLLQAAGAIAYREDRRTYRLAEKPFALLRGLLTAWECGCNP